MIAVAVLAASAFSPAYCQSQVSPDDARAIAKEAYNYGLPLVMQYGTIHAFCVDTKPQYEGPVNSLLNIARVFTPDDTAFVTPVSGPDRTHNCL